ncbi:glycerol-3-phosphate dehydrogenase [Pontibaca salina]|uniref:Glycerol-3-phosphate dehydrogenase n=1 Tax=Pontibaca salina TaxID=2795731 RepID=A0A934HQ50_9RHOB|nr:glycerol-3-phosphate dehydrogenase [Pontibaca salina]MBI6629452.1 glycerol-3-phosphate dehydrogenase [Pontibaca salina]
MARIEPSEIHDLFVIGGGVNGCGIARDAAGRGHCVVLAEMHDLASATSSASTKLFHGGLRYLEYFEFHLVREALIEREILLRAMPHIAWPMRFVLPYHTAMRFDSDTPTSKLLNVVMPWLRGRRPAWLIRLGLFFYDHLGGRHILPATTTLDLRHAPEGAPLKHHFVYAYEYSDCWVEDSRLVVLNARDAAQRGAQILTRTKVTKAERRPDCWRVTITGPNGESRVIRARALVNAGGPWVGEIIHDRIGVDTSESVRLVRGSHIVTRRLYDHDKCYFLQGSDGRIIFAIPYETDFTLIGTTDAEHDNIDVKPVCTPEERDYLLDFANQYFRDRVTRDDIVWTYSGVRPLHDEGATSATAATRDYTLKLNAQGGAPVLNVFGGKITTYRRLAETALDRLAPHLPAGKGKWTALAPLPGGDFAVNGVDDLVTAIRSTYPFLAAHEARRLVRAYGTDARVMLGDARQPSDLGRNFGAGLSEREVIWLIRHEFAHEADDILWRRSKLGLRLSAEEAQLLEDWIDQHRNEILATTPPEQYPEEKASPRG